MGDDHTVRICVGKTAVDAAKALDAISDQAEIDLHPHEEEGYVFEVCHTDQEEAMSLLKRSSVPHRIISH
jgi:hypothetical protein